MFLVDMGLATVGCILTFRPLDAQIRSANPFAAAWMPALICYPPFIPMTDGGPLDYHPGTAEWHCWLGGHPLAQALLGAVLSADRDLRLGHGGVGAAFLRPDQSRHPDARAVRLGQAPGYLSKNLFWWLSTLPLLSTGSLIDSARATLTLAAVSGAYYWRARTEERHLRLDPAYIAYSDWIDRHGLWARLRRQKLASA